MQPTAHLTFTQHFIT